MNKKSLLSLLIVLSYCFLFITGKKFSGFFLEYLIIGFFNGIWIEVVSMVGISLIILGIFFPKEIPRRAFNLIGITLMIISLIFFFYADQEHNNSPTFKSPISLGTLAIFVALVAINILRGKKKMQKIS